MRRPTLILLILFLLFSPNIYAILVDKINIEGTLRIGKELIRKTISHGESEILSNEKITIDIKNIFNLGYFTDVKAYIEEEDGKNILTYEVSEKPTIKEIEFTGNKKLSKDELEELIQTKKATFLDENKITEDIEKIKKSYMEKGFYLLEINYKIKKISQEEIKLTIEINEGKRVLIRWINFVGNEHFTDSELKSIIQTKEGGLLGLMTEAGLTAASAYNDERFKMDRDLIVYHYLRNGYLEVKVKEPLLFLSKDRGWISVTLKIEEGPRFYTGKLDFSGDLDFGIDQLQNLLKLEQNKILNRELLERDVLSIQAFYQDRGYAYANVIPRTRIGEKSDVVDITYEVEKGDLVTIDKINITGNLSTRDKIIRRHLEIYEGDTYNASKIKKSEYNISRMPYFKDVKIKQSEGANPKLMTLEITVTEQSTGTLSVGAGFNSVENIQFIAQIQKTNLFGYGWIINLQTSLGSKSKIFNFNFVDPFFLDTDLSLSVRAFNRYLRYIDFTKGEKGGELSFGYPIYGKNYRANFGYGYNDVDISNISITEEALITRGATSSVTLSFSRDTRNKLGYFETTKGELTSLSSEFAGYTLFGGDNSFTRMIMEHKHYIPLFSRDVPVVGGSLFQLRARLGYIFSFINEPVPFFEKFFPGGLYSIRGFEIRSLGPTYDVASSTDPEAMVNKEFRIGGNKEILFNFEYLFSILEEGGIKGVLFFDIGNAFGNDESIDLFDLRKSVGFGIRWFSPIAPFRFEWGFPLDRRDDERSFVFDFSLGTPF